MRLDVDAVRQDFPVLDQLVHGKPLVYLDNAATTHKPNAVIEAVSDFFARDNANVHRAIHMLGARATEAFEDARRVVAGFIGAADPREIIFCRGTTEAVNLVARSYARPRLQPGDEILVTEMEHHSNLVPWQLVCAEAGATVRAVPIHDDGALDMDAFERLLGPRTRMVAVTHASNALGTVNPVQAIIDMAHDRGVAVLVDGAQAVAHLGVDVGVLGADFYAFSGHKMYGPTGIGCLYGRAELLNAMPPWQGGGEMIREVRIERSTFADIPARFEAGTPNIAGAVGLGAAVRYLQSLGVAAAAAHKRALLTRATELFGDLPRVRLIGTAPEKIGVLGFDIDGVHAHDVGTVLDHEGIAVRAGHHCAQPVMRRFDVPATVRASFAFYNTFEEVEALARGVRRTIDLLG